MLSDKILLDIVESGILAPSADNNHVFRFDLDGNAINLWPSPEFASTRERHRLILGLLSLGAVVENMSLRANELGFDTRIDWPPTSSKFVGRIAQLTFTPGIPDANNLASAIPARHTNRRMFSGPALTDIEMAALTQEVGRSNTVQLIWLKGNERRRVHGLVWRAESERFLRKSLHSEIFSSIRFDLPWNSTADSSIPPGALEIELPMRPLFKALRHWWLMRLLNWLGFHRLVGARAGWLPCWQAPSLAVLATSLLPEEGAVEVGRAFERIWLRSTLLGLALQPLAASAILTLQHDTDSGATRELRAALNDGWRALVPAATPMMVFRVGRAVEPTIRSGRQTASHYATQDRR
jgi:hypothetical protein